MNAVIQSSAYPLVVLERNTLITQALLGRLSAYTGSISRVSDLHRGKIALSAQRLISVLFLAGKRRKAVGPTRLSVQSPRYVPAQHLLHRFFSSVRRFGAASF